MRFMAKTASERFGPIAQAFGLVFDAASARTVALECADRMAHFIAQFGLPQRLGDVQVPRAEIREVAGLVHAIMERAHGSDLSISREQVESVLVAAY
jgi:alcohol dehydrogenase class IV